MKLPISFLFAFLFCLLSSQPVSAQNKYNHTKKFSVKELQEDFAFTKKQLEKYHPGIYWYVSKERFDALSDSLYNSIDQPMTELEFYSVIHPLFQKISERHTGLDLSDAGFLRLSTQVKTFPLSLKCIDDKLFIDKNGSYDTTLVKGTHVLEINGRSAEWIVDEMKKKMITDGYNTTSVLRLDIEAAFWHRYFLSIDTSETFNLQVRRAGEDTTSTVLVAGATRVEFKERTESRYPNRINHNYPVSLEIVDNLSTAVFTINTFVNNKKNNELGLSTHEYFKYVFDQLQKRPSISNLVIDVRQNYGGDAGSEIEFLTYITKEKNKVYKRVERNRRAFFFKKDSTGKFYSDKMLGYTLEPKPNLFDGQIYLLTSGKTNSAASVFSSALAYFRNAIVIGEETGGGFYGATAGSSKKTTTPNVKLNLLIPKIRLLINVTGQPAGTGLLPAYQITQTYEDFMDDKDTEMNFALKMISSQISAEVNIEK
jgi:hypothetical protein